MKSLVDLLECLLLDCGRLCAAPVLRDVLTLRKRVKHEGDGFITIALPRFCQDFERSLDLGRTIPGSYASFGTLRSGVPEFLQGLLHRVFDKDGVLLREPSIDCIRAVRQICLFGKKVHRPCSKEREVASINEFKKCDSEVVDFPQGQLGRWFNKVAAILYGPLPLDGGDLYDSIVPTHGPGATEERVTGNAKWRFRRWHNRLEQAGLGFYPLASGESFHSIIQSARGERPTFVEPEDEAPARVCLVPKTQKTPRIIAIEPVCMQFAQQGIARLIVRHLERGRFTRGHLNFKDQSVNQSLAKEASKTGKYATLDMSEASDRVSVSHVSEMLKTKPDLLRVVMACRSTRARVPDGDIVTLRKFASMGSALCFPLEAMVFFTSIIASRLLREGLWPTARNVFSSSRSVYVYGDDLIVPADEAAAICVDLESFGFKVNSRKSFWTGKFRESCGSDCYDGEPVTPVYLRRDAPTSRADVQGLLSAVATVGQLETAGLLLTADALRKGVERHLGLLPKVDPGSPAIGWLSYSEARPLSRWNRALQREEILAFVAETPKTEDPLEGHPALAKCFRKMGKGLMRQPGRAIRGPLVSQMIRERKLPSIDVDHLATSTRRYGLTLKRRWVPKGPANHRA